LLLSNNSLLAVRTFSTPTTTFSLSVWLYK
jgi:hypothetical protein